MSSGVRILKAAPASFASPLHEYSSSRHHFSREEKTSLSRPSPSVKNAEVKEGLIPGERFSCSIKLCGLFGERISRYEGIARTVSPKNFCFPLSNTIARWVRLEMNPML